MDFIDLEKVYDRVNRGTLWQVLRMFDMFEWIKSVCLESSSCVRGKEVESEWFRIDSWVRQGSIMHPWLFMIYLWME